MLKQRVLTALVALPLLLGLLIWGPPWSVAAFLAAVGLIGWIEYARMAGRLQLPLLISGLVAGLGFIGAAFLDRPRGVLLALLAGLTLAVFSAVFLHSKKPEIWAQVERTWLGLALVFIPLGAMTGLAAGGLNGRLFLIFLLLTVFAGDTGAYFVGRAWGRAKLCPSISPNKTWAGLWGGLLAGALAGLAGGMLDGDPQDLLTGPLIGLGVAGLGVVGDLSVSMVKRHYRIKDAGSLLPGHGGILDRLDSFILAAPWLYAALQFWS